jgi:hypothetical protein
MSQEIFNVIFEGLRNYWLNVEIEDKSSIFSKEKITEKEFKKLNRKSGGTTLKIIKSIKLSILEKGKCYYSQREMAKKFKVSQQTIQQSMNLIEKVCQTKFIRLPKSVINNQLSNKSYFRRVLIPPSLYSMLTVDDQSKLTIDKGMLTILTKDVDNSKLGFFNKINDLKNTTYIPIYNYLYNLFSSYTSYKQEEKRLEENSDFPNDPSLFFKNKDKLMKYKLKKIDNKKRVIVDYKDFGLHPKQFMNHVELHRELEKWLEICINNNYKPNKQITKLFLTTWNNFGNKRFIRHRPNEKSLTFKLICLALCYRMHSENINLEQIEKAIENFNEISSSQGRLMHVKKLDCLSTFLWNSRLYGQKDYFSLCILDKNVVLAEYYNKNEVPPERAFERVRKMFGTIFYKDRPELGKEVFRNNYRLFSEFTNNMIYNHRYLEMCKFTEEYMDNPIDGFTDYIMHYFSYVYKRVEKSTNTYVWTPRFILDQHAEFVGWTSNQGAYWKNFGKKKNVSKRFKLEIEEKS